MDQDRPVDPFVKPADAIVFNNSYVKKSHAAKLILFKVIFPKLDELNISTKKYTANVAASTAASKDILLVSTSVPSLPQYSSAKKVLPTITKKAPTKSAPTAKKTPTVVTDGSTTAKIKIVKTKL
jgi:hypothetical protein